MNIPCSFPVLFAMAFVVGQAFADPGSEALEREMVAASQSFLDGLEDAQRAKASEPFGEQRKQWHYVPLERSGLSLGEMTEGQKRTLFRLLASGLSAQGVQTVRDIISLEDVLRAIEGEQRRFPRTPDLYHIWLYGDPGDRAWGWRFEGHHLSISATIVSGEGVSMSPSFYGANPAEVPSGELEGFRVLPEEEDLALELLSSLDSAQRAKAIFDTRAPRDIFTGVDRSARPLPIEGLSGGELNEQQLETLKALVASFLRRNREEISSAALESIEEEGWNKVRFGWAGSTTGESGHYYFIQGESFLIEYDNTQNRANHVHSVWRDFDGDFGEDLLSKHHQAHAH